MATSDNNLNQPPCFGNLDMVFPMGDDGLRCSPEACMACDCKTECLRTAMARPSGVDVHEEMVDRAYESGRMGFLERWAKRKRFSQQKKRGKRTDGKKEDS